MRRHRKSEEGAVLLLLIVMMSAVVLIVASLLRFNTQNIRFAAIEAENEQAMYLAEGVADSIEFYLLEELANDDAIESIEVGQLITNYTTDTHDDYLYGLSGFMYPTVETIVGESAFSSLTISVTDANGGSFWPDASTHELELDILVSGGNSHRKIRVTFFFPAARPADGYGSFFVGKELNYSNSL